MSVEFDDGDDGNIPLEHVRLLPQDFPMQSEYKWKEHYLIKNKCCLVLCVTGNRPFNEHREVELIKPFPKSTSFALNMSHFE